MYVIHYKYSIKEDTLDEFREIQDRVYNIYKANGALYHIILVSEETKKDIVEILMFRNRENYEAFKIATEANLDLYSLTHKFGQKILDENSESETGVYNTIFDESNDEKEEYGN